MNVDASDTGIASADENEKLHSSPIRLLLLPHTTNTSIPAKVTSTENQQTLTLDGPEMLTSGPELADQLEGVALLLLLPGVLDINVSKLILHLTVVDGDSALFD